MNNRINNRIYFTLIYLCLLYLSTVLCSPYVNLDERNEIEQDYNRPELQFCDNDGKCMHLLDFINNGTRRKRDSNDFCLIPLPSADRTIKYRCSRTDSQSCETNGMVPEFTAVEISCNRGYSSLKHDRNEFTSVCYEKRWVPPIERCYKLCDKLHPENVDLQCFRKNLPISCDENSLTAGDRVHPTCKYSYTYENLHHNHQEIICKEDGKWDNALFSCVQECGRKSTNPHDSTWQVAIREIRKKKGINCFGTMISPRLILTTESCVYSVSANGDFALDANSTDYEVFVQRDNRERKVYKIKEFRFFDKTGPNVIFDANRFHEVMIVILEEDIIFNSDVSPACIHWTDSKGVTAWNATAKVANWQDSSKKKLNTGSFPFLSHEACKQKWTYPYFVFFWADMMFNHYCSKRNNDTFLHRDNLHCLALEGENLNSYVTGSGIVFEENGRYFLGGIAGAQFQTSTLFEDPIRQDFERFMADASSATNSSQTNSPKTDSLEIVKLVNDSLYLDSTTYHRNFASLIKDHSAVTENQPKNPQNLVGVIDLAGYVDWIKKVQDEINS